MLSIDIYVYTYTYTSVYICEKNQIHQSYHSTYVQNNRAATCLDCERAPGDPHRVDIVLHLGMAGISFQEKIHGNPGEFDSKTHGKHWWPWKIEELDSETIMLLDFDDFPTSGSSSWKFWGANGCNFCICTSRFPMSIDKHTVVPCSWVIFTMQFCTLMRPYLMGRTGNDVVPSCLVVILPYLMAGNPSMTLVLSAPHLRWLGGALLQLERIGPSLVQTKLTSITGCPVFVRLGELLRYATMAMSIGNHGFSLQVIAGSKTKIQ